MQPAGGPASYGFSVHLRIPRYGAFHKRAAPPPHCLNPQIQPADEYPAHTRHHFAGQPYQQMREFLQAGGVTRSVSAKYRVDAISAVYNAEGNATEAFD